MEHILQSDITALIQRFGDLGVFIAMFLESSIVPIPSEVVIIGAGALGITMKAVLIFGALGATCGACVGYCIGRYAAMPVIVKMGKYVGIKPHHIEKAETFAKKYGVAGVLIGRLVPIIPFKVFSIAAGITEVPFVPFVIATLIGVVPRICLLTLFGYGLMKYKLAFSLALLAIILIFIVVKLVTRKCKNAEVPRGDTSR